jgi:hypothetical protein
VSPGCAAGRVLEGVASAVGSAMQLSGNASAGASGCATHRERWACSRVKPPEGGCASDGSPVGAGPFTGLGRNRPVVYGRWLARTVHRTLP